MPEKYKVLPLFREDKLYACEVGSGEYALDWHTIGRDQGSVQKNNALFDSLMRNMSSHYQISWGDALNQHFAHLLGLTDYIVPADGKKDEWIDSDGFVNCAEDYRYVD